MRLISTAASFLTALHRIALMIFRASGRLSTQHLVRRIAWRLQVLAQGDLTECAERRAREIANDADLKIQVTNEKKDRPCDTIVERGGCLLESNARKATGALSHHRQT